MEETNGVKRKKWIKDTFVILLFIVLIWFSFSCYEMYRVKKDKKPLICFNEVKDVEDDDEYSIMCYGLFYKYKEYYYRDNKKMSAREFTLFFTDFKRETK